MDSHTPINHPTIRPHTRQLGVYYETLATQYLQRNHFTVLRRNYYYQKAEIDIIARRNNCLHFIEVKARTTLNFGHPETFVSWRQQQRIKMAAENFIIEEDWHHDIQFDILALTDLHGKIEFAYFEDVFI